MKIAIGISTPSINHIRFKECYDALVKNTKIPYDLLIYESRPKNVFDFNYSFTVNSLFRGIPDADYYVVLNGDCCVTPNWLEPILKTFEQDSTIGIVGPTFISTSGMRYNGGVLKVNKDRTGLDTSGELITKQRDILFVIGVIQVISKECVKKIGFWDERLILVFNDLDYCIRAWVNGFRVVCQPESIAIHDNSKFVIEALEEEKKDVWSNIKKMYSPIVSNFWDDNRMLEAAKKMEDSNKAHYK